MARRRDDDGRGSSGRGADPYPAPWEADIALRDGTAAHLRPILPGDADALQAFHQAQSEHSRYLRFFAPMPTLSPRDLERFTVVDHHDRVALVVFQGEAIIAVGRFDRVAPHEAEVAFNVADRQQGRGLGSVLLEHLAAAGREVGIRTFVAEVLPQNSRMLSVFTDAGFDVRRHYEDGIVEVAFDIDPTDRSEAVRLEREHRAEARAMERMLTPSSILVAGVSAARDSVGGRILSAIEASGFEGPVHVVTRDAFEVRGRRASPRIADVPGPVDLAVLALRPEDCIAAVADCARVGVHSLVVPTEGFADAGDEGARAQRRLVSRARRFGMRVLGPAAFGFLRTGDAPLNVSFAPRLPQAGRTALAGQSSALAAMILSGAAARGVGIREFVGAGNRADVSINDCLQHWEDDAEVGVIGLALESMGNPRKFTRIARRITRHRPVVVLRPPALTIQAPPGHDVRASTLPRRALDQVLASAGVVGTRSVDHLVDVVEMLDREGVPAGTRVGLLANTPALGAALRGAADEAGLQVVAEQRHVPAISDDRLMVRALTRMAGPGGVDLVLAGVLDPLSGDPAELVRRMAEVARGAGAGLGVCLITEPDRYDRVRREVREDHALPPVHPTPALLVRAAAGAMDHLTGIHGEEPRSPERSDVDPERARRIVHEVLEDASGPVDLDVDRTRALLGCYGLELLASRVVGDPHQAVLAGEELGFPVALKSTDPLLAHRADLGGVRLGIADAAQLLRAAGEMREELSFSDAPLLVQPMAPPGVAVVVRSVEDPSLGPVVSFSLAGDADALLEDVAYAIPPLDEAGARRLISRPATAVRLAPGPGLPGADLDALAEVVVRVGMLAEDLPEIARLALHPVVASADGVHLVGARIRVAVAPNRTDQPRRALQSGAPDLPPEVPAARTRRRPRGRMGA